MKKRIYLAVILFFGLSQFIKIDKTNPPVIAENDILNISNSSDKIKGLMKSACYDCHSNETKYPWYMDIAPISWWTKKHVNDGRSSLNYSEWNSYSEKTRRHKLEESALKVRKKWMPIRSYLLAHSEARISDTDRELLAKWFEAQI